MKGYAEWAGPQDKPAWTWEQNLSVLVLEAQVGTP